MLGLWLIHFSKGGYWSLHWFIKYYTTTFINKEEWTVMLDATCYRMMINLHSTSYHHFTITIIRYHYHQQQDHIVSNHRHNVVLTWSYSSSSITSVRRRSINACVWIDDDDRSIDDRSIYIYRWSICRYHHIFMIYRWSLSMLMIIIDIIDSESLFTTEFHAWIYQGNQASCLHMICFHSHQCYCMNTYIYGCIHKLRGTKRTHYTHLTPIPTPTLPPSNTPRIQCIVLIQDLVHKFF